MTEDAIKLGKHVLVINKGRRLDGVHVLIQRMHYSGMFRTDIDGHGAYASVDDDDAQTSVNGALALYRKRARGIVKAAEKLVRNEQKALDRLLVEQARLRRMYEDDVVKAKVAIAKAKTQQPRAMAAFK